MAILFFPMSIYEGLLTSNHIKINKEHRKNIIHYRELNMPVFNNECN